MTQVQFRQQLSSRPPSLSRRSLHLLPRLAIDTETSIISQPWGYPAKALLLTVLIIPLLGVFLAVRDLVPRHSRIYFFIRKLITLLSSVYLLLRR